MLLDMSNVSKRNLKQKRFKKGKVAKIKKDVTKKVNKKDFFRIVDLVKKSDLKNKEYVTNDYPLNDIRKINYPKFFSSLDNNLNNTNLSYNDLDTKSYLNCFGISSSIGQLILSKSKKFKRKIKSDDEIEKWCTNDIQLIDLKHNSLNNMIRPFELIIERLNFCPICADKLLTNHSCLKKGNRKIR